MDEINSIFVARSRRIRSALMLAGALVLFLAGLLLLLAPASRRTRNPEPNRCISMAAQTGG